MSPRPSSRRRSTPDLVLASIVLLVGATLTAMGAAHWLVTLLPAAYPCGETFHVHPSCRLADPGAVDTGHLLMIAVPAICTVVGAGVAVWTFVRWRRALLPVAVATTLALVAYLWGQSVADAALAHVVPW